MCMRVCECVLWSDGQVSSQRCSCVVFVGECVCMRVSVCVYESV